VVVDMDTDPRMLAFYNLDGRSFANSMQAEVQYSPLKSLDLKAAYKFYDVQTTINGELLPRQFVSRHRALFNAAYATKFDKWKFDFTTQWYGSKRLPDTYGKPAEFWRAPTTPAYFLFNAQITKTFKKWDMYVGGENLSNFTQPDPILAADRPFGPDFDASLVWAPIFGRMLYAGIRVKVL
jgi:outer membrane receptor for ferrienterochelin and colicins